MEKKERIQIPISAQKRQLLESISIKSGFDSVTDTVRFLINNLLNGSIRITLGMVDQLDKETEREILESLQEKVKGKTKIFDPLDKDFHTKVIKFADE